jgi:ammonium transporter, Amt family
VNKKYLIFPAWLLFVVILALPSSALAGDPSDSELTQTLNPDQLNATAINFVWLLLCSALVFMMQAGFIILGAGLIRAKNTVNYITKCFSGFAVGVLGYWAVGFAFMFGGATLATGAAKAQGIGEGTPLIGTSGFFLAGSAYDVTTAAFWFFQVVFAVTATAIVAGAIAERTKPTAYLLYALLMCTLIYPIFGHWVWGNGWLANLKWGGELSEGGAIIRDFAGSAVVHIVGGTVGLMGAWLVGPRRGKFDATGKARPMPGHNMPYVLLGTALLFFGWFGFNGGSSFAATDLRISIVIINTLLSGAAGAVSVTLYMQLRYNKVDPVNVCNGTLAGLVGVTAPCAFIAPWAAVVIGLVAGLLMLAGVWFVEHFLKIDDPAGAFGVHGVAGIWGGLAVGIFADGSYLGVKGLIAGNVNQFIIQLIGTVAAFLWAAVTGFILFFAIKYTIGLRASDSEELAGLDEPLHTIEAYPKDVEYFN